MGRQGDGALNKGLSVSESRVGRAWCRERSRWSRTIESENRGLLEYPDIAGSSPSSTVFASQLRRNKRPSYKHRGSLTYLDSIEQPRRPLEETTDNSTLPLEVKNGLESFPNNSISKLKKIAYGFFHLGKTPTSKHSLGLYLSSFASEVTHRPHHRNQTHLDHLQTPCLAPPPPDQ